MPSAIHGAARKILRVARCGAALLLLVGISACGDIRSPDGNDDTPLGAKSRVPAPSVEGPISGGLRGHPWAGTVEALAPLAPYDFVQEEYFYSGTAEARDAQGAKTGNSAGYSSRILVQRPRLPKNFNGTVVLEWFNVSAEAELPIAWMLAHDEIEREGYAYVGVSAQITGVSASPISLKLWDPLRYAPLQHPGDAYDFDIFAQAARALFAQSAGPAPLGPLKVKRVIAFGESQSAGMLRTYVNYVHPDHRVIDAALLHTWPGPINEDVEIPVLMFLSEAEIAGTSSPLGALRAFSWAGTIPALGELLGNVPGAGPLRMPIAAQPSADHRHLRVWEVAGASHADEQFLTAMIAQLSQDLSPLAQPLIVTVPAACVLPLDRLDMARASTAALHQLDRWLRSGKPPASLPRVQRQDSGEIARDDAGFALGGIRMPNYAVPVGLDRGDTCPLLGSHAPFSNAELRSRYVDTASFRSAFAAAAARNVDEGTLLAPEAEAYVLEAQDVQVDAAP